MPQKSLKSKATSGVLWSAVDKFGTNAGQFVIGIVLARILLPKDFGLVGMLSVFITLSQVFIDSGMQKGLIQKKDRTEIDFSTVFLFNLAISCGVYALLFISAPYIADFYDQPQLVLLTRVLGINIIINSLAIVQRAKLSIDVDFKTLAKANILGIFLGGGLAIAAAQYDFGVWALVIKTLVSSFVIVVALWYFNYWCSSIQFSQKSFKELFIFGYKLLLTGLYARGLQEIYNVTIGKAFTPDKLGFYTRASGLAKMSAGTLASILQQVTFPILSSLQDERERMISVYRRMIKMTCFIIFPVMILISVLAKPIIIILLTKKWIEVVPLLQWLCFAQVIKPISSINLNLLNAVGRSDLFLKVDLSKFPLFILALVITLPLGIEVMVIGQVVVFWIGFFFNAYLPGKMFGYGAIEQLKDMLPVIFSTVVMGGTVFYSLYFIEGLYYKILIGLIEGILTYLLLAYILKLQELYELKELVQERIKYIRNK